MTNRGPGVPPAGGTTTGRSVPPPGRSKGTAFSEGATQATASSGDATQGTAMRAGRRRPPRSLADDLRMRSDEELAELLQARPDLLTPSPADLTSLAARAGTRASVHRALAVLDQACLDVAAALTVLPVPVSTADLARACDTTGPTVRPYLQRLLKLGLAFGSQRAANPVRVLAELFGPYPAGLGPPIAELLAGAPARLGAICSTLGLRLDLDGLALHLQRETASLLTAAPDGSAELLHRLDAEGIPIGTVRNARREPDPAAGAPVEWLLARGLLVPLDDERVVVPREVALGLRARVLTLSPAPPAVHVSRDPALLDRVAPAAATEIVRHVHELLRILDRDEVPVLRSGGLGARELTRLARQLALSPAETSFVLIVAAGARLIAPDGAAEPAFRATAVADEWRTGSVGTQWLTLVRGWLRAPWSTSLAGSRDERHNLRPTLSPATERESERRLRGAVLGVLTAGPAGAHYDEAAVLAQLRHDAPRGPVGTAAELVPLVLAEAHTLGLLAFGCPPGYAVALSTHDLDALLPSPVSRVLVQADLTAVAPGPLVAATEALLESAADVESRGAATVYRFTAASVRRALDAGLEADDLLSRLAAASVGELPQPLDYLVRDVARRHGTLRVGAAGSYLRSDDPQALTELLAHPRLAGLGWRRLAPTVLAAPTEPARTLDLLRSAGQPAVAEGPDGTLQIARQAQRRAPVPDEDRWTGQLPPAVDARHALDVVSVLRRVELARSGTAPDLGNGSATRVSGSTPGRADEPGPDAEDIAGLLSRLQAAAAEARTVWLTYSDSAGELVRRQVQPLAVSGGQTRVLDPRTGMVLLLPAHRLVAVADS